MVIDALEGKIHAAVLLEVRFRSKNANLLRSVAASVLSHAGVHAETTVPACERLPSLSQRQLNEKRAAQLKTAGNAAFVTKDFIAAARLFAAALANGAQSSTLNKAGIHSADVDTGTAAVGDGPDNGAGERPPDHPDMRMRAVLLANRSAVYMGSGNQEAALSDAVACVILDPGYAKGWFRLGTALGRLGHGQPEPAATDLDGDVIGQPQMLAAKDLAFRLAAETTPDEAKALRDEAGRMAVDALKQALAARRSVSLAPTATTRCTLSTTARASSRSDGSTELYTSLHATTDAPVGSVLLVEHPAVHVSLVPAPPSSAWETATVQKLYSRSRCSRCLNALRCKPGSADDGSSNNRSSVAHDPAMLPYALPCSGCINAVYCGVKCSVEDWVDGEHDAECGEVMGDVMRLLPAEMLLAWRLTRLRRRSNQNAGGVAPAKNGHADTADDVAVRSQRLESLVDNVEALPLPQLVSHGLSCWLTIELLKRACASDSGTAASPPVHPAVLQATLSSSSSGGEVANDGLMQQSHPRTHIPEVHELLRALCQVASNAHSIKELVATVASTNSTGATIEHAEASTGIGVYAVASACNHSCRPNALCRFDGDRLSLVATEDIKAGTEIRISYGPTAASMPLKADRQRELREKHHFNCACDACSEDDKIVGGQTPASPSTTAASNSSPPSTSATNGQTALGRAKAHDDKAKAFAAKRKWREAADEVDKAIALLTGASGDPQSPSLAQQQKLQSRPELGFEYFKLASLRFNSGETRSAGLAAKTAYLLLKLILPPAHDDLQELEQMMRAFPV